MEPLERLRGEARLLDGLFTTEQARECGVTDRVRQRLLARGWIEAVHPRVFRFTGLPWTWESRQVAAVLACRRGAYASHTGAARLLGLPVPAGRPEITVTTRSYPRLEGVRVHRSRALEPRDTTTVSGIPCTTGSRTLIDLAARLTPTRRMTLVDEAICAGIVRRANLHERATVLSPGRRGVATLVDITRLGAEDVFWSGLERAFSRGIRTAGLPLPRLNAPIRLRGRLLYADALWEPQNLVAELHGLRFHDTPAQRRVDGDRQNRLALAGYRYLVFSWQDVFEDMARVVATLSEALGVAPRRP